MPTPVGVARQYLSEAAVAALDDAVAVAKRRNHAQTTSLHVVSALLSLPSSALREACARSRSDAYTPRLQFRALELCVGVALDRVAVSKTAGDEPPVSNSLMAAIKRSQANQRRHPETFLLYQQQLSSNPDSPPSISAVKVELKHFVMSILDDPLVSRVFADAGFRTQEMKFTILNPPSVSRFISNTPRPPPPFFCSLNDYEQRKRSPNFPFLLDDGSVKADANSRRISEVLFQSTRRNPLLIGACAGDAYTIFLDCLKKGEAGFLPKQIQSSTVVSLEHELSEFTSGRLSEATMELKLKRADENCRGPGMVVHLGDLKAFVDSEYIELVFSLVTKLKKLLLNSCGKLWLIGFMAEDIIYRNLLQKVPSIESDLDLSLLPITSSAVGDDKSFKSSLMKSFVPFGGFFSMPSELGTTRSNLELSNSCNEKYELEVSALQKGESNDSVSGSSSWLQIGGFETSKRSNIFEAKEGKSVSDARVVALRQKWDDICSKLHSSGSHASRQRSLDLNNSQNSPLYQQRINLPIASSRSTSVTPARFSDGFRRKINSREGHNDMQKSHGHVSHLKKELEGAWKVMAEKIYWQMDAIQAVNRGISRWRHEESKGCLWMSFLGPDKVGKRKLASFLSDIVFGRNGQFLCFDLSLQDSITSSDSILGCCISNLRNLKSDRKMTVDCIAEDLKKHPNSVVLFENVDKADVLVQESISLAIKTGKFQYSLGKYINIHSNTIFLLGAVTSSDVSAAEFPEEKIIQAKNFPIQISFGGRIQPYDTTRVRVSRINKRKLSSSVIPETSSKRFCQFPRSQIDLNLPVDETEVDCDDDHNSSDSRGSSTSSASATWLQEVLEHVDENIVFKPFDFDSVAHRIVREIEKRINPSVRLEIDEDVMVQMVAASWLAEEKGALDEWIDEVLCTSLREASSSSCRDNLVMKLERDRGGCFVVDEKQQFSGLCLPKRIHF